MPSAMDCQEPILASWRVSEVLRRYPALLETLIGVSPAFTHLRNPLVRKVQSRLVTVAQAAQVAGLEPAALVRTLNAAAGLAPAPELAASGVEAAEAAPEAAFERALVAADLDVRPALARGEEPFGAIMAAAATVRPGEVLRLRAGFEPVPLYAVLGRRGFAHRACQRGPDEWEVLFLKTEAPADRDASPAAATRTSAATAKEEPPAPAAGVAEEAIRAPGPSTADAAALDRQGEVTIDVSNLAPPEPMVRILEACAQLAPGQTLRVEHARRPIYLYPRLNELGYTHETRDLGPGRVELRIRRPADGDAA